MHRSSNSRTTLAAAVMLAAVASIVLTACGTIGLSVDPAAAPSAAPSAAPIASPNPQPTAVPSDGPTSVDLENLTGHDVSIVINDETGTLSGATSGTPGDGMSVRWFDATIGNLDAQTLRLGWVGLPRDEDLELTIIDDGGKYRLGLVQSAPPADSDAVGFDRVLELLFDSPVSAADVEVSIAED